MSPFWLLQLESLLRRTVLLEPSLDAQLMGALCAAVSVKLQVLLIRWVVLAVAEPKAGARPWYLRAVAIEQRKLTTLLGVKDPDHDWAAFMWRDWWAIGLMHGLGGALCLPVLLCGPTELTCLLGRWGALVEVGWEVTDLLERLCQRLFTKDGHIYQPAALLALACLHHPLACCMVIPMNMYYPTLPLYFQMVCLLMFAACIALLVGNYAQTLDVSSWSGLCKMVLSTLVLWGTLFFTRIAYYWVVFLGLLRFFDAEGQAVFWWVGAITGGAMMPLIGLAFLADASKRLAKFSTQLWSRCRVELFAGAGRHSCGSPRAGESSQHQDCLGQPCAEPQRQSLRSRWSAQKA